MKRSGFAVLVVFLLVSADTPEQRTEKEDLEALQGTWVLETTEWMGEKAEERADETKLKHGSHRGSPAELRELKIDPKQYDTTLTFKGSTYIYKQWYYPLMGHGEPGIMELERRFQLDVKSTPKVMKHWTKSETYYRIYTIKGDTLQLCTNLDSEDRKLLPNKFATKDDENVVLFTYRREKK